MTVPDLNEAIRFFEDATGAKLLWRAGPFAETPTGFPIECSPSGRENPSPV
jgi:catechol 2,3-dioxygenase-like lactoylglutathione lyase family enzyme